jgi:hypothetical protein
MSEYDTKLRCLGQVATHAYKLLHNSDSLHKSGRTVTLHLTSQKTNMFDQPFYTHYNVDNNHNWLTCDSACYIVIYAFKTLSYMTNNHRMDLYLVAVAQI